MELFYGCFQLFAFNSIKVLIKFLSLAKIFLILYRLSLLLNAPLLSRLIPIYNVLVELSFLSLFLLEQVG